MALGRTGNYIVEVASVDTQDEVSYLFGRSHCFPTKRFACVLEKSIAECCDRHITNASEALMATLLGAASLAP
jgi:hypothetical protein